MGISYTQYNLGVSHGTAKCMTSDCLITDWDCCAQHESIVPACTADGLIAVLMVGASKGKVAKPNQRRFQCFERHAARSGWGELHVYLTRTFAHFCDGEPGKQQVVLDHMGSFADAVQVLLQQR